MIAATIDLGDNVTDVTADGDSQIWSDAAIAAVDRWTFTPGMLDDAAVPSSLTVKIDFSLHD